MRTNPQQDFVVNALKELAHLVRSARKRNGLSQEQAAERAGVSLPSYRAVEHLAGPSSPNPTVQTIAMVCEAVGVQLQISDASSQSAPGE